MAEHVNILLVDDDDVDAQIFKRGLKKIGHVGSFVRVRDGAEALELLSKDTDNPILPKPHIILLDINMPRMNGHEFLEKVRSNPALKETCVFVFTTSNNRMDIDRAYRNNANGYIVKPDNAAELSVVLQMIGKFWDVCKLPTGPIIQQENQLLMA